MKSQRVEGLCSDSWFRKDEVKPEDLRIRAKLVDPEVELRNRMKPAGEAEPPETRQLERGQRVY